MTNYDDPWKGALDLYFIFFLAFFFRQAHDAANWEVDDEVLDTELRKLAPEAEVGKRLIDKLVKVVRKGSGDAIYFHAEFQCRPEENFEHRLHVYNYRGEDRYNHPIVTLAVLGDDNPKWRPREYVYEDLGCRRTFTFPSVKLLDYAGREAELEASDNPFALLVLLHLAARATENDQNARRAAKSGLIRHYYTRGLFQEDVRHWHAFFDWLLNLPEKVDRLVWAEALQIEKEKNMPFLSSVESIGFDKGLDEGRKEGRKEGLDEGRKEGLAQARGESLRQAIEMALELRFGADGLALLPDVARQSDLAVLEKVFAVVRTASLDDLRRLLP